MSVLTNKFWQCLTLLKQSFLNSRGGSSRGRISERDAPPANAPPIDRDRDNFSRWRDRQYFGPRRWLESALRDNTYEKDSGMFLFYIERIVPF